MPIGPEDPVLRLLAHVRTGEILDLANGAKINAEDMSSWDASRYIDARVIRDILRGRLVSNPDPRGVCLRGARLVGRLDLQNLSTSVNLDLRECFLPGGLAADDASLHTLRLVGCRVECIFGPAIAADRLMASVVVLEASTVTGHGPAGAVALQGARLGGLYCDGATLSNECGPALRADSLRVDQDVFLREKKEEGKERKRFEAVGAGENGAVCLLGARMARLECDGAILCNDKGPALRADSIQVDQRAFLRHGFEAVNAEKDVKEEEKLGTVRLNGARLGLFAARNAVIHNESGPALVADAMQVERGVLCDENFKATGTGNRGVVQLIGTRIGGRLELDTSQVCNTDKRQTDRRRRRRRWKAESPPPPRIALDGLTYAGVPKGTSFDWRELLKQMPVYAAQPYQHLAAAHRAAGHDKEARDILIDQRKDQIKRGGLGWWAKAWARFTGLTLGYGYKPWRALFGLAGVVAAAVLLSLYVGTQEGLAHTKESGSGGCRRVESVGVGLKLLNLPLLRVVGPDTCVTTSSSAGDLLTVAGWILQLFAWAFASLFIAGFTSAVRKT